MNTHRALERHALDAHRLGWNWEKFWDRHGPEVRQAEPFNVGRFHKLVRRLLALVVSGDCDGVEPIDGETAHGIPWEADDDTTGPLNSLPPDRGETARQPAVFAPRLEHGGVLKMNTISHSTDAGEHLRYVSSPRSKRAIVPIALLPVTATREIDRMEPRRDVSDLLAVVRTTGLSWTHCWAKRMPDN